MLFNEVAKKLTGLDMDLIKDNVYKPWEDARVAYTDAPAAFVAQSAA